MRRIGAVAMSGAERSRRWRLKRKLRLIAERTQASLEQLPLWVGPGEARPIIEAWHGRGLEYPITAAQWSTLSPLELEDESTRRAMVDAIEHGPGAPAPAFALWGAVLVRLQRIRAELRKVLTPRAIAHAQSDPPPPLPEPEPREDGLTGIDAFRATGRALFGRAPCGCRCHAHHQPKCSECASTHVGDPPRAPERERPQVACRFTRRARR